MVWRCNANTCNYQTSEVGLGRCRFLCSGCSVCNFSRNLMFSICWDTCAVMCKNQYIVKYEILNRVFPWVMWLWLSLVQPFLNNQLFELVSVWTSSLIFFLHSGHGTVSFKSISKLLYFEISVGHGFPMSLCDLWRHNTLLHSFWPPKHVRIILSPPQVALAHNGTYHAGCEQWRLLKYQGQGLLMLMMAMIPRPMAWKAPTLGRKQSQYAVWIVDRTEAGRILTFKRRRHPFW